MASVNTLDGTSPPKTTVLEAAEQLDDTRRAELAALACELLDAQDADK